jgi:hypothetical protein
VLAVAVAARLALLPAAPSLSGDIYRYVWEGRVILHGGNPYQQSPDDPALAALRDRVIYPGINHKDLATIYPPLAEAGFALVALVSPTVAAFKAWNLLHDLALVLVLMAWALARGASPVRVIAYAWNPLVLVEYSGSGHNDPVALLWLVVALMLARERPVVSALALVAGVLTKLAPLAALPFLMRRWPWRARLVAATLLALGLGAFLALARGERSGLGAFWGAWANNELAFHYIEQATGHFVSARAVAIALLVVVVAWAYRKIPSEADATRLTLRTALLLSPVLHPWYLGWVLAFEPLAFSAPWLLLSLTAVLNYGVLAYARRGARLPPVARVALGGVRHPAGARSRARVAGAARGRPRPGRAALSVRRSPRQITRRSVVPRPAGIGARRSLGRARARQRALDRASPSRPVEPGLRRCSRLAHRPARGPWHRGRARDGSGRRAHAPARKPDAPGLGVHARSGHARGRRCAPAPVRLRSGEALAHPAQRTGARALSRSLRSRTAPATILRAARRCGARSCSRARRSTQR